MMRMAGASSSVGCWEREGAHDSLRGGGLPPARMWDAVPCSHPSAVSIRVRLRVLIFSPRRALAKVSTLMLARWATSRYSSPLADRKSTRLNSSHVAISYAVFCLKKEVIHECGII